MLGSSRHLTVASVTSVWRQQQCVVQQYQRSSWLYRFLQMHCAFLIATCYSFRLLSSFWRRHMTRLTQVDDSISRSSHRPMWLRLFVQLAACSRTTSDAILLFRHLWWKILVRRVERRIVTLFVIAECCIASRGTYVSPKHIIDFYGVSKHILSDKGAMRGNCSWFLAVFIE